MVAPYLWIKFYVILLTFWTHWLWIALTNLCTIHVWWVFIIGLEFWSCFHSIYKHQVLHNVKKRCSFCKWKLFIFCPILWLSSIPLVMRLIERFWHFFHKHIKTLCVIIGGVQIHAFFTWKHQDKFFNEKIWHFNRHDFCWPIEG